jgi:hypothetical protein
MADDVKPTVRKNLQDIQDSVSRYRQPLLISLSVVTVLAHDLIAGLPKSITLTLLAGFPIVFCWFWGRLFGLKSWGEDKLLSVLLLVWALFLLYVAMFVATKDDSVRNKLCRSYLTVMQGTRLSIAEKPDPVSLDRLNAASGAASALKCWS